MAGSVSDSVMMMVVLLMMMLFLFILLGCMIMLVKEDLSCVWSGEGKHTQIKILCYIDRKILSKIDVSL